MKIIFFHIITKKNRGDQAIERSIKQIIKNKFPKAKIIPKNVQKIPFLSAKEISLINKSNLIIIGGGGQYSRWFFPMDLSKLKQVKVPIIIYSVGYLRNFNDRELSKKAINSIKELNGLPILSSVRDKHSKDFMKNIECNVDLVCDPAIFFKGKKDNTIKFDKNKISIGINIAYHGWNNQEKHISKIVNTVIDFAQQVEQQYPVDFYFMKHHPNEKKIIEELKKKIRIKVISRTPEKLLGNYKKIDFFVGMLLHSTILSFNANTPMISIGYDPKNLAFMKLIGMKNFYLDYRNITGKKLFTLFEKELKQKKTIKERFKKQKKDLWKQHEKFLEKVKSQSF